MNSFEFEGFQVSSDVITALRSQARSRFSSTSQSRFSHYVQEFQTFRNGASRDGFHMDTNAVVHVRPLKLVNEVSLSDVTVALQLRKVLCQIDIVFVFLLPRRNRFSRASRCSSMYARIQQ